MKNLSLNQKIWGILAVAGFALIAVASISIFNAVSGRNRLNEVLNVFVKRQDLASRFGDRQRLTVISLLQSIADRNPSAVKKDEENYLQAKAEVKKILSEYQVIASAEGKAESERYEEKLNRFFEFADQAVALAVQGKKSEATDELAKALTAREEMQKSLLAIRKITETKLAGEQVKAESEAWNSIITSIVLSLIAFFTTFVLAYGVLRSLGRSINEIVKSLSEGAVQVTSASAQIAAASEELSQASTEQAASLEETAASVEQMTSMIARNTESANNSSDLARKSSETSEKGKAIVEKMIEAMGNIEKSNGTITSQISESNNQIAGIVKVVEQIAKKTQVINEIVNKTELLSFNASVEAARAGEHGKGFAVVAEEVGNLARMSGTAAEEIGQLIETSIESVNKVVQETASRVAQMIEVGKRSVEEGTLVAEQCGAILVDIVTNVKGVTSMSSEIASASNEQANGISEISKAMTQLDQATQQNAATSEECASAAEELSGQAESLKSTVGQLVLAVRGRNDLDVSEEKPAPRARKTNPPLRPVKTAPTSGKVVKLRGPTKSEAPVAKVEAKRAVNAPPPFDDEGFQDV